jgi:hypothetical protein
VTLLAGPRRTLRGCIGHAASGGAGGCVTALDPLHYCPIGANVVANERERGKKKPKCQRRFLPCIGSILSSSSPVLARVRFQTRVPFPNARPQITNQPTTTTTNPPHGTTPKPLICAYMFRSPPPTPPNKPNKTHNQPHATQQTHNQPHATQTQTNDIYIYIYIYIIYKQTHGSGSAPAGPGAWALARRAALHDARFPRLTEPELSGLAVKVAALRTFEKRGRGAWSDWEIGTHGIIIGAWDGRGTAQAWLVFGFGERRKKGKKEKKKKKKRAPNAQQLE